MSATVGVVTGAGRGIGRACARNLVGVVDALVLADRDADGVAAAADELSVAVHVERMTLDVTDATALSRLAATVARLGQLRAVVHAAGISPTMADWSRILSVDLVGTALVTAAVRPLVGAGTAMVCLSSMAAHILVPNGDPRVDGILDDPLHEAFLDRLADEVGDAVRDPGVAYAWAKRGVQRLVQREALAWGPLGGRICSVSPGMIDTAMGRQELDQQPAMALLLDRTPVGRLGRPEDVAAVVSFLLSDGAAFVTGCDVLVDGGVCAAMLVPPAAR